MEENVGSTDSIVRLALGAILAIVGIAGLFGVVGMSALVAVVVLIVAAVLLWTGYTRQCLLYGPLGIDTSGKKA